jgi:hypothetical protein
MLSGNKPYCAIYLLYKLNILDACLKVEQAGEVDYTTAVNLCITLGYINEYLGIPVNMPKITYQALLTLPLVKYNIKVGKETLNGSKYAIKESLKQPTDYIKDISIIIDNLSNLNQYISKGAYDRLTSGKLIKTIKSINLDNLILASICYEYVITVNATDKLIENIETETLSQIIEKHKKWENYINQENLKNVDTMKPILDGERIQKEFNLKKGKEIGVLLDALIEEQIANPYMNEETSKIFIYNKLNNK